MNSHFLGMLKAPITWIVIQHRLGSAFLHPSDVRHVSVSCVMFTVSRHKAEMTLTPGQARLAPTAHNVVSERLGVCVWFVIAELFGASPLTNGGRVHTIQQDIASRQGTGHCFGYTPLSIIMSDPQYTHQYHYSGRRWEFRNWEKYW